jgi:hypothetical protein
MGQWGHDVSSGKRKRGGRGLQAVSIEHFKDAVAQVKAGIDPRSSTGYVFGHLAITRMAFSSETQEAIEVFVTFARSIPDPKVGYLFWFACLSVLEEVSFTRKDGQYLRWDIRSGRPLRSKGQFRKSEIPSFREAICAKLETMLEDIANRNGALVSRQVQMITGSCLSCLPQFDSEYFDLILTSPPYCNRYDYTRTYALELAFLGYDNDGLRELRQSLLSCTVENKSKREELRRAYDELHRGDFFEAAEQSFAAQAALHEVLDCLRAKRAARTLNNPNILNLVENYFFEMNIVIRECARILTPGGHVVMVNDNVQYAGEEIPVDLILSDFAASAGLNVDHIWVLPQGKGNSSQQMGEHGRRELRKCVYVWSKP